MPGSVFSHSQLSLDGTQRLYGTGSSRSATGANCRTAEAASGFTSSGWVLESELYVENYQRALRKGGHRCWRANEARGHSSVASVRDPLLQAWRLTAGNDATWVKYNKK